MNLQKLYDDFISYVDSMSVEEMNESTNRAIADSADSYIMEGEPMKERFYSGTELQKDLEFCKIMSELIEDPRVLLLSEPESVVVHHMEYDPRSSSRRYDTNETHIGYDRHYVTFMLNGRIFYVQASEYYPFTDANYPGQFNFIAHNRIGMTRMKQCSYYEKYHNIESVLDWIDKHNPRNIGGVSERKIDIRVSENDAERIASIVKRLGGVREKIVMESNPVFLKSETWNDDHRVVKVISSNGDTYGYRKSFDFDIVTNRICG